MEEMVNEKARIANDQLKLKMEKKEITDEQTSERYSKFSKKIQKKKIHNKKKRTKIDI